MEIGFRAGRASKPFENKFRAGRNHSKIRFGAGRASNPFKNKFQGRPGPFRNKLRG